MIRISSVLTASAFALAVVTASAQTVRAEDDGARLITEFSAQKNKGKQAAKPKASTTVKRTSTPNRTTTTRTTTKPSGQVRTKSVTTTTRGATTKTKTTIQNNKGTVTKTTVNRVAPPPRHVTFNANRQTYVGLNARHWNTAGGAWVWRGNNYKYWRTGPWRVPYGAGWRTFVAVGLVAPIVVGAATYYPYAYVSAPQDVCEGVTEDGCQLTWSDVEVEEGGTAPQCVTYCPWQN